MTSAYVLIVAVLLLGGLLAALGDRLGSRVGKARLKLFNLRPKQTAVLVTVVTGTLISASTLGVLFATSASLRQGVFRLDEILEKRREALLELQSVTEEKKSLEREKSFVSGQLARVNREKNQVSQELSEAKSEQEEVEQRLQVINADFEEAKQQLRAFSSQAAELRSEVQNLNTERQQLLTQREDLRSQITQLLDEVKKRDRELTRRDETIAQREREILAQERRLQQQNTVIAQQTQKLREQDRAVQEGQQRLADIERTLQAEIAKRDTAIVRLDTAIAERDRALQDRETRLQQLETTLQTEIARRDAAIENLDAQIASRDNALRQREARLGELEQQQTYLRREVAILEQYYQNYQALRQGNVALVRGQVLSFGAVRITDPSGARNAVDQLLRQANRSAIEATQNSNEDNQDRVVQITESQVEQVVRQIQDGKDYVVRLLSAGNYVRGETEVRVFADVVINQDIFNAGDVIATVSIEPDDMTQEEIQKRLDLLLAASQFRARRAGVLGDIQVGDGKIVTLIRFLEQLNESEIPLDEIKAVAYDKADTAGGLRLQLMAMQNGRIVFRI